MAEFKVGKRALRKSERAQETICFTATNSGSEQVVVWQDTEGDTKIRLTGYPDVESSLALFTTLQGFSLRVDANTRFFEFRGYNDFAHLYEFYTIDRVEVSVYTGGVWGAEMSEQPAEDFKMLVQSNPIIIYAIDHKDSAPVTQAQILSVPTSQWKQPEVNSPIQLSYKPATSRDIDLEGVSTAGALVFSPKLHTYDVPVEHYGVKFAGMGLSCDPPADYPLANITFIVRQYVTFYEVRVPV